MSKTEAPIRHASDARGLSDGGEADASLPDAVLRTSPADFLVDELPAYEPSGAGSHLYVTFRKTGRTTPDAVRAIAQALGAEPRDAGYAGMKDRHAVTTQTASFAVPLDLDASALFEADLPGIELLSQQRHGNKLKTGHLRGNRFTVTLRELAAAAFPGVERRLQAIATSGVPNAFGPQRFGRDGDNPERAFAWVCGQARPPRDPRERRLLFSALQSLLFNRVLAAREADGSWSSALVGDWAQKHDSGGLFLVKEEEHADAAARALAGLVSPTGPMFGVSMRWPEGKPLELERAVFDASGVTAEALERHKQLGEGTRRAMRLKVDDLTWESHPSEGRLKVGFTLAKGGYATTVLERVCRLRDASRAPQREALPSSAATVADEAD